MTRRLGTPNKPALSSKPIQAALRRIAEYHGYTATRGPLTGKGNAIEVILAIDKGEIATVLLPDEQRAAFINNAEKLAAMIEHDDWIAAEAIKSIAEQLWEARQRETDD